MLCQTCTGTGRDKTCPRCDGDKMIQDEMGNIIIKCPECEGTGKIECKSCCGDGEVICPDCSGTGEQD
jgi:hypothetical protein